MKWESVRNLHNHRLTSGRLKSGIGELDIY